MESSGGGWSDAPEGEPTVAAPVLPVGSRYRIEGRLGEGGMGEVFRAWDRVLSRYVALKCVHSQHHSPLLRHRLLREARVTARLEHPGILPVLDAGELPDGRLFYTMRVVDGQTLDEAAPEMARGERLRHLVEAVRAVAYAHGHEIVHRDIKPSNIMVGSLGETYVVDWGLARAVDEATVEGDDAVSTSSELTTVGAVVGTRRYLSPEGQTGTTGTSSDVFALGATLVETLCDERADDVASWRQLATTIGDPVLCAIAMRALSESAQERYETAREMLVDLLNYLDNAPVGAYEYTLWESVVRSVRRHRGPVGLAVTAVVVGSVVAGVAAVRVVQERDRALVAEGKALLAQQRADHELAQSLLQQADMAAQDLSFADAELAAARVLALADEPLARGVLMATLALQPEFVSTEASCDGVWATGADGRTCVEPSDLIQHVEPARGGAAWLFRAMDTTYVAGDGTVWSAGVLHGYRYDALGDVALRSQRLQMEFAGPNVGVHRHTPCGGHMLDTARLAADGVWGVCDDDRLFHLDWQGRERFLPVVGSDRYHRAGAVDGPWFYAARDDVVDVVDLTTGEVARTVEPRAGLIRRLDAFDSWWLVDGADATPTLVTQDEEPGPVMRMSRQWEQTRLTRQGELVTTSGPKWALRVSDALRTQAKFAEGIASASASHDGTAVAVARGESSLAVVDLETMAVRWDVSLHFNQVAKSAAFSLDDQDVLGSVAAMEDLAWLDADDGTLTSSPGQVSSGCSRLAVLQSGWWCQSVGNGSLFHNATQVDPGVGTIDISASGSTVALALARDGRVARIDDTVHWVPGALAASRVGISASGAVMAWDTEEHVVVRRHEAPDITLTPRPERVLDIAVSPDGRWVAASGMDEVYVWDAHTGEWLASLPHLHAERVATVLFTDQWLVTAGWDGQVRKWSLVPLTATPTPSEARDRWHLSE